jgi:hypothetical protein
MFTRLFARLFGQSAYQSLVQKANQATEVDIPRLGKVHVLPMDPGMRLALSEVVKAENNSMYGVYLWLIGACVVEFKGRDSVQIGMDIRAHDVINALGDAVLDVSGISTKGQVERVKKSEEVPS